MKTLAGKFVTRIGQFQKDIGGGATLQTAMLFGAVALALSVLAAPQLKSAADTYAENRALGIDRIMTGSVQKAKEYTIRKSVLDK